MTLLNISNLLLGAILGAILGIITNKYYHLLVEYISSKRKKERIRFLINAETSNKWIVKYYKNNKNVNDLYNCKIHNYEIQIPFLTRKDWVYYLPIPPNESTLLYYAETEEKEFPIDYKLIKKRQKLGQNLFNDPTLYLDRIEQNSGLLNLHVKECNYYQMATSLIQLEEESFKGVKNNVYSNLKLRDSFFYNLDLIQKLLMKPFSMGCTVALVLKTTDSFEILIHTRSHETVCAGGLKTLIPNFGLAPVLGGVKKLTLTSSSKNIIDQGNDYNLIYYNFLKEYLEELFDYEKLISFVNARSANPYWFYALPEAKAMINLIESGNFNLEFLGFGFEAMAGTAMVNLLGIINDAKFSYDLKESLKANWEVSVKEGRVEIDFVDYRSPKLENWLRENKYTSSGAFTVSRALERLSSMY